MSNWNGNISWLIYKSPDFYLVEFDAMKIMAILYPVDLICACGFSTHLRWTTK
jgi:hypothetical protein